MDAKNIMHIEKEFFEKDDTTKVAKVLLEYDSPEDIFNTNFKTTTPMLDSDFIDMVSGTFDVISDDHKIDFTILFQDMGGYSEAELKEIFHKNFDLRIKKALKEKNQRNQLAYILIIVGIVFFCFMILLSRLWVTESIWKEIFIYIADIATTVTFWEAMTILVVERRENAAYVKELSKSNLSLHFEQK